jgi:hypothetical protein
MEQHLKILGILNIIFGGLGICGALVILLVFGIPAGLVVADGDPDAAGTVSILGVVGGFIFFLAAIFSVPALVAGIGILTYREWARTWTIVASVLHLINIPFGTALAVYGLWVMFKDETATLIKAGNPGYPQR